MTDRTVLFKQVELDAAEDAGMIEAARQGDYAQFAASFAEALPDMMSARMQRNEELRTLATINVTPSGGYNRDLGRTIRRHMSDATHSRIRSTVAS
jgi:hypothetical protein